jgi:hypothetical protein
MEGTPVTAETWNAWFDRFKAEKALAKAKALSATDFKQKLRQVRRPPGSEFEMVAHSAGSRVRREVKPGWSTLLKHPRLTPPWLPATRRQSGKAFFESNQKNESSGWEEELDDADYDQLEDEEFDDELLDEFLAATDQNALAAGQQAHESDT